MEDGGQNMVRIQKRDRFRKLSQTSSSPPPPGSTLSPSYISITSPPLPPPTIRVKPLMLALPLGLGPQHEVADGVLLQPHRVGALHEQRLLGPVAFYEVALPGALARDDPRGVYGVRWEV